MKTFTKSMMVAVALMAGVTTANAQDEGWMDAEQWVELTADMWHEYAATDDQYSVPACWGGAEVAADMVPVWNMNTEVGAGACEIGAENVTFNMYADISDYDKLILMGTGGPGCRVMCNRIHNEGAWKNLIVGFNEEDPHWNADLEALVIDLNDIKTMPLTVNAGAEDEAIGWTNGAERVDDFVHLHCLKNAWGGEFPVVITGAYLWKAEGGQTAIKGVKTAKADGKMYNLKGQEVKNPVKGIYIQNGKKVIVK